MQKIRAEGGEEGWLESQALAESLGFERARQVGTRLAWMRHYGMLEYDEERKLWRLTEGGERVTKAKLRAAQARELETLPDEAMIEVMASVTTHYRYADDPMIAHVLRREFLFGTQPQKR